MAVWIGVDVGGTFTDLILYDDESGDVRVGKEPTTPAMLEEGVAQAVSAAVPADALAAASYFLHGTTAGLNTLLERKGAVVGLLVTRGFRDVLEIRRGDRQEMYNLLWKPPPPLVPRRLRVPVTERITADGSVLTPLDETDVERAVDLFRADGVTAVAVAFLNAYANPEHELLAERALRKFGFDAEVSLSHRVTGEYREYERTSTTAIDAYIRPVMGRYLRRLESKLAERRFGGTLLVTRSGGGAMTFREADERPVETIQSGPVAGVLGAAELCRRLGIAEAITADVGGTSFDTCLIVDSRPRVKYEGRVADMPVQIPWIDVRSIGAGGGSIARVDAGGLLRVGPESAGAEPGPACYGRGGVAATVTDAALFLGMLGFGELAGDVVLDRGLAEEAIAPIAERLALDIVDLARGVITIMTSSMANAIREVTVEEGQDPRGATLIPFGGAGPLFATQLAAELDIERILVPPFPGNFSAWGLLAQDVTRSAAVSVVRRLDEAGIASASRALAELFERITKRQKNGASAIEDGVAHEAALDMRYLGQEYTLSVGVAWERDGIVSSPLEIREAFMREYDRTYGHTLDAPAEIVSVRATTRTALRKDSGGGLFTGAVTSPGEQVRRTIDAYSFTRGEHMPFGVVSRASLTEGARLSGPLIIVERTATTYVDAGFDVEVHLAGAMLLTAREGAK